MHLLDVLVPSGRLPRPRIVSKVLIIAGDYAPHRNPVLCSF